MKSPDSHFFHYPLSVGELILNEEESTHAIRVCRAQKGDFLRLCDGEGHFAKGIILETDPKECRVLVENIETASGEKPRFSLALACLKDDGNEEVVFHASQTELNQIVFLRTDYSQEPKNSDCKKIIRRAELKSKVSLKQSLKPWLTAIQGPIVLDDFLANYSGDLILADIDGDPELKPLNENVETTLLVGPEGGFSAREIELIKAYSRGQVHLLKLGKTRLRAKTAAIIALGKCLH